MAVLRFHDDGAFDTLFGDGHGAAVIDLGDSDYAYSAAVDSADTWRERIIAQQASGQSIRAWCLEKGCTISINLFASPQPFV